MPTEFTIEKDVSQQQHNKDYSVFVGGLANTETNESLMAYFAAFGGITSCQVQVWKNHPQKCRGYAIVVAGDKPTFDRILSNAHKVGNRVVECKPLITDPEVLNSHNEDVLKRKVFVSGLSKKLTDEQFREFFSRYGAISMAYIVKHHIDRKSRGFGFICFADSEAKNKLLALKQIDMHGKIVHCADYLSRNTVKANQTAEPEPEVNCSKGVLSFSQESEKKLTSPPTEVCSRKFSSSKLKPNIEATRKSKLSMVLASTPRFLEDESNLQFHQASVPIQYSSWPCRYRHQLQTPPRLQNYYY
jgi:RNA recognition motif-containing protein